MAPPSDDPKENEETFNVPPLNLPKPDVFDTRKSKEGKNSFEKIKKKEKKTRKHPTDPYRDVRKKNRSRGCCLGFFCLALFLLVLTASLAGYAGAALLGPLREGHQVRHLDLPDQIISEPPTEPTIYLAPGSRVTYQAASTGVPISIVAREIKISGSFAENVILRGVKVDCEAGANFASNLDILTVLFRDGGMRVNGEIKGKTFIRQKQ